MATPEMIILVCVMLLTYPTGWKCSGELCTGLGFGEKPRLGCMLSNLPADPTPLSESSSLIVL